jgi:hypothetical protein
MSFETFVDIFNKFDKRQLLQIAFGIGSIDANPDLYKILSYTKENGVIPNLTINGYRMKYSDYEQLAAICGAVSTSLYDKDVCFNAVRNLTDAGMKQANIHMLFSNETYDQCMELIDLIQTDERLEKLNSVVFLTLKGVGDRNTFTPVKDKDKYDKFVTKLINSEIRYGWDSCGSSNFTQCLKRLYPEYYDKIKNLIEPCESSLFSYYINCSGIGFPCSFAEHKVEGIDLSKVNNFSEVWNHINTKKFRNNLLDSNRNCNLFNLKMY